MTESGEKAREELTEAFIMLGTPSKQQSTACPCRILDRDRRC